MFNKLVEKLQTFTSSLQQLSKKELEKYIIITLSATITVFGAIIYYSYNTSSEIAKQIKRTNLLANKSFKLLQQYDKLQSEENRLQTLLGKHKNFNIKIYFEQFCKKHSITPEPGWNTTVDIINERFEEITLPATFKGQTTEKLVNILEKLDKKELIYIKSLGIRPDKEAKKISFDITLATKRMSKA